MNFLSRNDTAELLPGMGAAIPIEYRKRSNARRYILRLNDAGNGGCITIPRGGSLAEAKNFAKKNAAWLEDRLRRRREATQAALADDKILFRGEPISVAALETHPSLAGIAVRNSRGTDDLRLRIKQKLWQLAWTELPAQVLALAAQHRITVQRVSVRDQRSRWGSCSARGVISLNWRLVQTPEFVRDYIIVHELMHLREMNHSHRYWKLVYEAFPQTDEAEKWLKQHSGLLRSRIT